MTLDVGFGRAAQTVSITRTKAGPRRDLLRGGDLRAELRGGRAVSGATKEGWSHAGEGAEPRSGVGKVLILGGQGPEIALLLRCNFFGRSYMSLGL